MLTIVAVDEIYNHPLFSSIGTDEGYKRRLRVTVQKTLTALESHLRLSGHTKALRVVSRDIHRAQAKILRSCQHEDVVRVSSYKVEHESSKLGRSNDEVGFAVEVYYLDCSVIELKSIQNFRYNAAPVLHFSTRRGMP
jgi:hypothetical protein